jgi:hypothetical protein
VKGTLFNTNFNQRSPYYKQKNLFSPTPKRKAKQKLKSQNNKKTH